ncbi:hypothetical protein C8J57DRAFT_1367631 [Mycena rebaudengoi]|nr:hypothetical protein C8J57DRAFT_1367631 [Mycena rebaudengoi]
MAWILAATPDTSLDSTTDKFLASYVNIDRPLFTIDELLSTDVPRSIASEIASLVNKTVNGPDLQVPLIPDLATTLRKRRARTPKTYEFWFAPGVMVNSVAYRMNDPIQAVPWDVIAMEMYKEFKDGADPSDLRYLVQFHIDNPLTQTVLAKLYTTGGMAAQATGDDTEWTKWDANDGSCGTDAVLTLLGTDNGSGAGFILVDYHTRMREKKIAYMYRRRQARWWGMVIESRFIRDMARCAPFSESFAYPS